MRPDSQRQDSVPRTERRDRPADVIQFRAAEDGYTPGDHNPYDGFDAIDPDADDEPDTGEYEEYNPYEGGDIIDPDADDETSDEAEVLQMPRAPQGAVRSGDSGEDGNHGSPRKLVRRVSGSEARAYGSPSDYDDRGGYPLGANTPVSSYDEPLAPVAPTAGRPQGPQKKRHARHRGLIVFIVIIAALVGIYRLVFTPIDDKLAFSDEESTGLSEELSGHIPATPYYVLLLGSDAREGDTSSRTDTMILARIDPIESKVTLVSIPRDTMVELEGHGTSKINAAYAYDGAAGAVKAVHDLTGVSISHVAVVKFDGVSTVVDYLGGVTVDVPVAVNDPNYTGLVLSAGEQTMDGNTAMLFSRVRHGFTNGDYQRQQDQRILLQAILNKCLSLGPAEIPGLVDTASGLVSTDMRCYSILPLLLRFVITQPTVYSCSLQGTSQTVGGQSYEVLDASEVRSVMQRVDAGDDPSIDAATAAQQLTD